ncbi:MAG: hypothetical protein JO033_04535 [Acidobacteriaceae bacterium]|nr:hypothetical protein [Acidobacteriaceae bacterium]MBV9501181.1 hypothetical protein [Acidobacteriaceae bacterium]
MLADQILVFEGHPVQNLDKVDVDLPRPRFPDLLRNGEFIMLCDQLRLKLKKEHAIRSLAVETVVNPAQPTSV